jgi:hypothetical protein
MGVAAPLIVGVTTPEYGRVVLDASDGVRYHADLRSLSAVHCFPRTPAEWDAVAPDSAGLALIWACRFEVHIDQVLGLADRTERHRQSA